MTVRGSAEPVARPGRGAGSPQTSKRALRLLWTGQGVSLLGDQVTVLALPLVALAAGASVPQVAALTAAGRAPFLLLTLPAGVWVRRIGLRRSMVAADLTRAAALAGLPLVALWGTVTYAELLAVAVVLGAAAALFQVAYQSLTPLLTSTQDQLRSANTWLSGSEAIALTGGPALAGALVALVAAVRAVALDAITFLVSAATLIVLPAPRDRPIRGQPGAGLRREIATGLRFVLASPPLRAILASSVLFNTGIAGYEALLVVFAVHHLGLSAATLGLVVGLGGAGVPVGVLACRPLEDRFGTGSVLLLSGTLSGAGLVVAALATSSSAAPLIGAGTFVTAVGGGAWGLTALTTRQALSAPELRPMATAIHRWATYGVLPLGALLAGESARLWGLPTAMLVSATVAQAAALPLLAPTTRRLGRAAPPA